MKHNRGRLADDYLYTIPGDDRLVEGEYAEEELALFKTFRQHMEGMDKKQRQLLGAELLAKMWPGDAEFRAKTHWIKNKDTTKGQCLLVPNYAQKELNRVILQFEQDARPARIMILKARQIGFSTWIQSKHYDYCQRFPNRNAMTVSFSQESTTELFQKARHIHRSLWFPPTEVRASREVMELSNGSVFRVGTAGNVNVGRSETFHHLHLSEEPMWGDRGDEVCAAVLQCVPDRPGTTIFRESTAKGARGNYYETWRRSERRENDYYPFFAPWFWDPDYRLPLQKEQRSKFRRVLNKKEQELRDAYDLDLEQLAWRRFAIKNKCNGSDALFRQEYPGNAQEAFLMSGRACFNQEVIAHLERQAERPVWKGEIGLEEVA